MANLLAALNEKINWYGVALIQTKRTTVSRVFTRIYVGNALKFEIKIE